MLFPRIDPLNLRSASLAEYAALNAFANQLRAERLPDDPPIPDDEAIQRWQNIPAFVDVWQWVVWDTKATRIIGQSSAGVQRLEQNQHLLDFEVEVLPELRRQGLGRDC